MNPIRKYLVETQNIIENLCDETIAEIVSVLFEAWKRQSQIFIMGNGGSASTASHMMNDLSKATIVTNKHRMRVLALTDNISLITAWANDSSYENIFKEQLKNLLNKGDVVIGISASGNSINVLEAIDFANQSDAITIGWTGLSGGKLCKIVNYCIHVPTDDVGTIEGLHLILDHIISKEIKERIKRQTEMQTFQKI